MPKIISVEGTDHEFPDDATDAEIQRTLQAAHPKPDPVSHSSSGNVARSGTSAGPYKNVANSLDMLSNVPASAGRLAAGFGNALIHPRDTAANLVKTTAGLFQKMTPDTPSHGGREYVPYADAAIQGAKDRYGSLPAIGTTVTNDPVGAASDAALVQGGVSSLARGASGAARMLNMPGVANGASEVSRVTSPFYLGRKLMEDVPVARGASAGMAGAREGVYNIPLLGKPLKAAVKGAKEDFAKSAPDYVDPKVTAAADRQAQSLVNAKARVRAALEERTAIAAEKKAADALLPPEPQAPEPFRPNPAMRAKMPTSRSAGSDAGMPSGSRLPPPRAPAMGPDAQLSPKMTPAPEPVAAPAPVAPTPVRPNQNILRKGLYRGPANGAPGMPSSRPVSVKPRSGPALYKGATAEVEAAPAAVAPQQAAAPQQTVPAPPVAPPVAASSGPSAPEGSAVIPPVAGRPNRYGDMGGKLGEQVARDAHLKDTAVAKYLNDQKVTQGQFRAADPAQKARWAREANPKYKGYTDPDRIDDLANLLQPDAPTAPAGPTLYQGKQ